MKITKSQLRQIVREQLASMAAHDKESDEEIEECDDEFMKEKAPPGWEGTVKAMKKHKDITNPWALAWSMKNKGYKSHK